VIAATQGPEDAAGRSGNVEEVSLEDRDVLAADVPSHHVEDFCDPQSGALNQILVYVEKKRRRKRSSSRPR